MRPVADSSLPSAFSASRLAILGPGLIGGSLVRAVRRRWGDVHLRVWSRLAAEREAVLASGLADLVTAGFADAVADAELVFLCTPPVSLTALAKQIAPHLAENAVISDVASVKGGLVEELTAIFSGKGPASPSRYVGGHPMAGAETGGYHSARADLFENRVCLLTPLAGRTDPPAIDTVAGFWQSLGARTHCLSPQAHDEAVALVSHLPHLLSAALADYVGTQPGTPQTCAGPGWRDMTRLAGGSPEMWTEILSLNRVPVTNALRGILAQLGGVLEILEAGREADLEHFLDGAKRRRGDGLP